MRRNGEGGEERRRGGQERSRERGKWANVKISVTVTCPQ